MNESVNQAICSFYNSVWNYMKAEYKPKFKRIENWGGSADCLSPEWGTDFKCPTTLKAWLEDVKKGKSKPVTNTPIANEPVKFRKYNGR